MSFSPRLPLAAVSVAVALLSAPAFANAPPQVAVQGAEAGSMTFRQTVRFQGVARDPQGIAEIFGTIQLNKNKQFVTQAGQYSKDPARIQFKFTRSQATRWASQSFNLAPGAYTFRIRVEDGSGAISPMMALPFIVDPNAAIAVAPAATQRQAQAVAKPAVVAATATVAAAPAPAPAAGAKAANGMNYCSAKGVDADGDGFGWQNNASCIVAGSKADTHPTCASTASDPDGDGYGWENEKSCIVVTHCSSGSTDADGDGFGWENDRSCIVLQKANTSGFAACAAGAASDPDGDGYGWENNATCVVAK